MSPDSKCDSYNYEADTSEFTVMIIFVLYDGFNKL